MLVYTSTQRPSGVHFTEYFARLQKQTTNTGEKQKNSVNFGEETFKAFKTII